MTYATTLGQLKATAYSTKTIKQELRDNLIDRLKKRQKVFEGIIA